MLCSPAAKVKYIFLSHFGNYICAMRPDRLLHRLPPFEFDPRLITDDQSVNDIVKQVLHKHDEDAYKYDLIVPELKGGNVLKKLFEFCQRHLPYYAETRDEQTTLSPSGIIEIGRLRGVDCKHYANFIAGCLAALNRKGYDLPFVYRFAGYNGNQKDHVFVVVYPETDNEVWIDPAPIKMEDGSYYARQFNDRFVKPVTYFDKKVSMSAVNGLYSVNGASVNGFNQYTGAVGVVPAKDVVTPTGGTGPGSGANTGGGTGGSNALFDAAKSTPEAKPFLDAANQLIDVLPDGGIKNFLKDYIKNPIDAFRRLYFGKPFTSGAYHLGEVYMRAILGMDEIQNRGMVPDAIVPQANDFFTSALGVRVTSEDHIEQLAKSPEAYYQWMGQFGADVPRANVERAHRILVALGYPQNQSDNRRNQPWDLNKFLLEPYIYPLPGLEPNRPWNGTNPITNTTIVNGYPVSSAGTGTGGGAGSGAGNNAGGGPVQQAAGLSNAGKLLLIALAAGTLYVAFKPAKKVSKTR